MQSRNSAAEYFSLAVRQHQAGQLREAEQNYNRALSIDPTHVDSLHRLGVLALQAGRPDLSTDLIGRAISLKPRNSEFHFNIGLALGALERFEEAAEHNRQAIGLKPDYAEAHMNLGNALKAQGKLEEAIPNYEKAIALRPQLAPAHFNLANVFSDRCEFDQAEKHYREALQVQPHYAEAMTNLGNILMQQGKFGESGALHQAAIGAKPLIPQPYANLGNLFLREKKYGDAVSMFRKALALNPNYAEVHTNLGSALSALGKNDEALAHYEKAFSLNPRLPAALHNLCKALEAEGRIGHVLEIIQRAHVVGESPETRSLFADYLGDRRAIPYAHRYRKILMRAISECWNNPRGASAKGNLIETVFSVLREKPAFSATMARAIAAWPTSLPTREFASQSELEEIANDDLFRCILAFELIPGAELEKFLSGLRLVVLETAIGAERPALTALACALAQQCFINEYVFYVTDQEQENVKLLRERLGGWILRRESLNPLQVAAVAAYVPLHVALGADLFAEIEWPAEVAALVRQQVSEPREELQLRQSMPALTKIDDPVSLEVQNQYEENPYPRWVRVRAPVAQRRTVDELLRTSFPMASYCGLPERVDYLVAGCGTGAQVAETKSFLQIDRMLAIDLSRSSLAYAKRMAAKLGLDNVEFAQADILQLPTIGRTFDVIDSAGVLVALADPMAGWRILLSILRPSGVMRLGFYSELARQSVVAGRKLIAERGLGSSAKDIRNFRHEVLQMPPEHPVREVLNCGDFFSVSSCRDLLFHVQEHRFSLPQLSRFLKENDLVFLGFDINPETLRQYRERFPTDAAATDLDLWDQFEREDPRTFIQMYQFWVQWQKAD